MKTCGTDNFRIALDRRGLSQYVKASYPVRYGCYSEMELGRFRYQFSGSGEVKYITGLGPDWPHPAEWLKRTIGNDWVYYSTGSYYAGVVDLFGEYYLPCPAYRSNSLFRENPFARPGVAAALWECGRIGSRARDLRGRTDLHDDGPLHDFLRLAACNSPAALQRRADRLRRILQARVSVLPPDTRHVDYDVIPLMITDGCLYNCSFCEVKSGMDLRRRTRHEIVAQLAALKEFFGPDLHNYNSIYLGQHDALAARPADIIFAAEQAYTVLEISNSYMKGPRLFLFGSAESLLDKDGHFWQRLNRLPFHTHVNLGLESFDDETLQLLKKPVSAGVMQQAFARMLAINRRYEHIEVTANFLLGDALPAAHLKILAGCLAEAAKESGARGCVYLSPLKGSTNTRELLQQFRALKQQSRLPAFLYLIQRL